jgi:hypothetical protein
MVDVSDSTDEAAAAAADLLVLYGLAAAVIGKIGRSPDGREIADDILALGPVEYDLMLPDWWPDDDPAAAMLAAWRSSRGPGPVGVNIIDTAAVTA